MQDYYSPPASELKIDKPVAHSVWLVFLVANSGLVTIPALVFLFFFFTDSLSYFNLWHILTVSAVSSLPASLLVVPFRKVRWHWAAIAGSVLSVLFTFAFIFLDI